MSSQSYQNGTNRILMTTEYDKFKFDPTNRPINDDHLEILFDAISEKNLLHLFPIVVGTDFAIRDGQHRLKVAEALEVPIHYIVDDKMEVKDVPRVTARVRTWKAADYLHHYCALGYSQYLRLKNFHDQHEILTVSQAMRLCGAGGGTTTARAFREGEFNITSMSYANTVVRRLYDFRDAGVEFYQHKSFMNAVANLTVNPLYDHSQMLNKLEYNLLKMVKCPDIETYIEMINRIYNIRSRSKIRLEMMQPQDYKDYFDKQRKAA